MPQIVQQVAEFLRRAGVGQGDAVLVACSGGPDSAALVDVAMQLHGRGLLGPVHVLYVDHGLREDSRADGHLVAALAESGGATYHYARVEVDRRRASLEAAARDARYQELRRSARQLGVRWVLLGHTASDQAETVLMRILRGTGLVGLAGIPPRRGRYLRPLIGVTREHVDEYVSERGLIVARDPMNSDPKFQRNRVRHRWLRELREENPRISESLVRLADAAREQREVLDFAADQLLGRAREDGDNHSFDIDVLRTAPAAVVKHALAGAAQSAGGSPLEAKHLEAVMALLETGRGGTISLDLPNLQIVKEYHRLRLVRRSRDLALLDPAGVVAEVQGDDGPYVVRRWQPGDRMRPARLRGRSRKLSDLFTDCRVPREQRARARVVTRQSDGEIVWAEHIGPAYGHRVEVSWGQRGNSSPKN